jgi:hypothetical protein
MHKIFIILTLFVTYSFAVDQAIGRVKNVEGWVYVKHQTSKEVLNIGDSVGPDDVLISHEPEKVDYMISKGKLIGPDPKGSLMIKRAARNVLLKVGDKLYENDIITTKKASSMGILFKDDSVLSIGSESMIVLDKFVFKPAEDDYALNLDFKKGSAAYESGEIGKKKPDAFKFNVPEGTIAVRGTKFCVKTGAL